MLTLELGTRQVDGGGVGGGPGADDDDLGVHPPLDCLELALVGSCLVGKRCGSSYRKARSAGAEGASKVRGKQLDGCAGRKAKGCVKGAAVGLLALSRTTVSWGVGFLISKPKSALY